MVKTTDERLTHLEAVSHGREERLSSASIWRYIGPRVCSLLWSRLEKVSRR
jgi:hypothetical protein